MKKEYLIWHVLGSAAFIILPMFIYPRPPEFGVFQLTDPAIKNLTSNIVMVMLFYANYYFFVPNLFLRKKYLQYAMVVLLCILLVVFLPAYLSGMLPWESPPPRPGNNNFRSGPDSPPETNYLVMSSHSILLLISVILFSVLVKVREKWHDDRREKDQMELLNLKELINPHFLFNTLNNIYSNAIEENSINTANGILKLSGMMRYVLEEIKSHHVPLKKELNYVDDYIQLQRMRLDERVLLSYTKTKEFDEKLTIAPLILIPFIENAFKHGINPDEECEIKIEIKIEGNLLNLTVINRKVNMRLGFHEISGKGLKVTYARLELLYPEKFKLNLVESEEEFKVNLQLELHD